MHGCRGTRLEPGTWYKPTGTSHGEGVLGQPGQTWLLAFSLVYVGVRPLQGPGMATTEWRMVSCGSWGAEWTGAQSDIVNSRLLIRTRPNQRTTQGPAALIPTDSDPILTLTPCSSTTSMALSSEVRQEYILGPAQETRPSIAAAATAAYSSSLPVHDDTFISIHHLRDIIFVFQPHFSSHHPHHPRQSRAHSLRRSRFLCRRPIDAARSSFLHARPSPVILAVDDDRVQHPVQRIGTLQGP